MKNQWGFILVFPDDNVSEEEPIDEAPAFLMKVELARIQTAVIVEKLNTRGTGRTRSPAVPLPMAFDHGIPAAFRLIEPVVGQIVTEPQLIV